jgi:hypothetical protein
MGVNWYLNKFVKVYFDWEHATLLEKLAALIPRPRTNLVVYHGVLAPHSGWRARVVA